MFDRAVDLSSLFFFFGLYFAEVSVVSLVYLPVLGSNFRLVSIGPAAGQHGDDLTLHAALT